MAKTHLFYSLLSIEILKLGQILSTSGFSSFFFYYNKINVLVCHSHLISGPSVGELLPAARLCWCFSLRSAPPQPRPLDVTWPWGDVRSHLPHANFSLHSRPPALLLIRCIRTWKKVATACPSQSVTWYLRQPPVWETSPHWTSPTTTICPLTPAIRPTRRKKVSVAVGTARVSKLHSLGDSFTTLLMPLTWNYDLPKTQMLPFLLLAPLMEAPKTFSYSTSSFYRLLYFHFLNLIFPFFLHKKQ